MRRRLSLELARVLSLHIHLQFKELEKRVNLLLKDFDYPHMDVVISRFSSQIGSIFLWWSIRSLFSEFGSFAYVLGLAQSVFHQGVFILEKTQVLNFKQTSEMSCRLKQIAAMFSVINHFWLPMVIRLGVLLVFAATHFL